MSRALHVGLGLLYWVPDSGGSGTYARELVRALLETRPGLRITAWTGRDGPPVEAGDDWADEVEWVRVPVRSTGSPARVAFELGPLGLDARRRGVDVVHGLAYATPVLAPGVATVVTIHDLTWRHHPETVTRMARAMFGLLTAWCGRSADRVIAVSQAARDDLVRTAGLPAAKVDVALHGVAGGPRVVATPEAVLRERLGLPAEAPVVLSVGQLSGHKNLGVLVEALPALPPGTRLVLPGRATPYRDELRAQAQRLGVAERVVLPGFVGDADLEGLYALADAFALPSLMEGFGLPVAEAMRRGVPVACADRSSLPEVAGGAAVLFDPTDPAAVAAALGRLLGDAGLRAELADRGRRRAAELTWTATAEATLASYERAIAAKRGGRRR